MQNIELIQIQQYYENRSHSGKVTYERGKVKEEVKKVNIGDILSTQE
jgi:hypothetical protein